MRIYNGQNATATHTHPATITVCAPTTADRLPQGRFHYCAAGSHMYDDQDVYFGGLIDFLSMV